MKDLTTRKTVLGLLMTLVLAFSVQGIADALNFTSQITRRDSTAPHVYTGDPFEIQFSVNLETPQDVNTGVRSERYKAATSTDIGYAADPTTRPRVRVSATITTDIGYQTTDTHYYTVTTGPVDTDTINGVTVALTTNTRTWGVSGTDTLPPGRSWTTPSTTDRGYAADPATRPRVSVPATITVDATGANAYSASDNDTHYYEVTTGPVDTDTIDGVRVRLTTKTRNWATEAQAYYYNAEAVSITPGAITGAGAITILSINGRTVTPDATDGSYTLNEDERWGGTTTAELTSGTIRVRCRAGSTAGAGSITVADATTVADDYPTGASAATAPTAFSITIVNNPLNLATYPTIQSVSEGVLTHNVRNQISVTLTGSNSTFAEVGFEVLSGSPGNLYLNRESGSSSKKLLTYTNSSSVASVYLLPNSRTNQVRVWVSGQNPASTNADYARKVTYTYGFSDLTADLTIGGPGGNGQRGVFNTRLPNPFVVKVIDGTNRGFPGAVVTFTITAPASGAALFPHPDFRAEPVTTGGTQGDAIAGYNPLLIETDQNGEAKVHLKLDASTTTHTVTASYNNATRTFTTTGISAASTTYVLTVDSQHSAQAQSVALRTRAAKPLVVHVLEGGVNPVADVPVRFTVGTGTLSPRREADHLTDAGIIPNLPTDRTIETNARGEAWIDYIAGNTNGPVTIYARAFSHTSGSSFSRIDSANTLTFSVNVGGTPPPPPPAPPEEEEEEDEEEDEEDAGTLIVFPPSLSGAPGEVVQMSVGPSTATIEVVGDVAFILGGGLVSGTATARNVTLPDTAASYNLTVSADGYEDVIVPVTVGTGTGTGTDTQPGTLSITLVGARSGNQQGIQVTAQPAPSSALVVTLSGVINPPTLTIDAGQSSATRIATLPTTTAAHTVTASAEGYTLDSETVPATGSQPPPQQQQPQTVGQASSIRIASEPFPSGTANTQLAQPLRVQVLDANNNGVANVRVIFRVVSGQGRLSPRGNGRAIAVQTNATGEARATYTPLSASSTVRATAARVTQTVTFTITAGSGAPSTSTEPRDPGRGCYNNEPYRYKIRLCR